MRKFTVRDLTVAAMTAAVYAVLGYFGDVFGLTYGAVQFRFAEALTVLPFLIPAAAPGLALGCLITNLLSPFGPVDVIFGTLATAIAAWGTMRMPKWYLAAIPPIVVNALILPPIWAWAETGRLFAGSAFWSALGINTMSFVLGEATVCYGLGTLLLKLLPKLPVLKQHR